MIVAEWGVMLKGTLVRDTECLDGKVAWTLEEGKVVEQVAP